MIIWFLLLIFGKRQDLFQNHFKVFHNGTEFMVFGTHKKIEKSLKFCLTIHLKNSAGCAIIFHAAGMWLSLVERCVRDAKAAGSNPVIPTIDNESRVCALLSLSYIH